MIDKDATLQTVFDALKRFAERPALIAVRGGEAEISTYAQIDDEARRIAGGLVARGVTPGERIGLCAPNSPRWFVARLALIAIGATAVQIDHESDEAALKHIIESSGLTRIFVAADLADPVTRAAAGRSVEVMLLDDATDETLSDEIVRWTDLHAAPVEAMAPVDGSAMAALFYTSGTTGVPKGVPLTHANIVANLRSLLDLKVIGPDDRVLLPLPLHHSYPFIVGMMTSFLSGSAVVLPEAVAGPAIVEACKVASPTLVVGVPRLYAAIAEAIERRVGERGKFARGAFRTLLFVSKVARRVGLRLEKRLFGALHQGFGGRLRHLVSGGAPLDETVERTLNTLGLHVLNGWGLVETASVATFSPPDKSRAGTVGIPVPGLEVRIDGPDESGLGEVVVRGPNVFEGYLDNPEANEAAFTDDGWFRTGDLGRVDAAGYLSIFGRIKEVIVVAGGKNIAPEEVERAYLASPLIAEIAVLEHDGNLVALVGPDLEAARSAGTARIDQALRVAIGEISQTLPSFKRIAGYAVAREPLPRTRLGKYRRHLLPDVFERARAGKAAAPEPLSAEDEALLARPRVQAVWRWLQKRFPDQPLSPETSPQLDLGIDSLGWVELAADVQIEFDVHLSEEALEQVFTLRDLLRIVEEAETSVPRSEGPVTLTEDQTRWLAPTGPLLRALGFAMYALVWLGCRLYFRLSVRGGEALPKTGPFILAANHCSDIDPVVLAAALPWRHARATYWSGDAGRLFGTRLSRWFARAAQIFPVDDRAPATSLAYGAEVLAQDHILAWFPEEWRSPDGQLQPFLPGVGALVERSGAPVVPVYIDGTFEAMPRRARWPRPRGVRLRFGQTVGADALLDRVGSESDRPAGIAAAVRDAVEKLAA